MMYGIFCYIIIENFPRKFSPCIISFEYAEIVDVCIARGNWNMNSPDFWTQQVERALHHILRSNVTMQLQIQLMEIDN